MKNPGSSPTGLAAAMALALIPCSAQTARADADRARARHVIVISVDGLHESDLEAYIASHATSTLAKFVNEGVSYSNAHTPFPSDSFPAHRDHDGGPSAIRRGLLRRPLEPLAAARRHH